MMSSSTSAAAAEFARRQQSPSSGSSTCCTAYPWLSPLFLLHRHVRRLLIVNPTVRSAGRRRRILLQQTAVVACLAVGQTLIILTAGIDLSVGAITILSMMVMATLAARRRDARVCSPC